MKVRGEGRMDSLQTQVSTLSHKVDALYKIVEQLNTKISEALSESALTGDRGLECSQAVASAGRYYYPADRSMTDPSLEHKDVLVDSTCPETNAYSAEQDLTPEIQIQRLTAQLTAAYNRIAALEEQLLAQRIH